MTFALIRKRDHVILDHVQVATFQALADWLAGGPPKGTILALVDVRPGQEVRAGDRVRVETMRMPLATL